MAVVVDVCGETQKRLQKTLKYMVYSIKLRLLVNIIVSAISLPLSLSLRLHTVSQNENIFIS